MGVGEWLGKIEDKVHLSPAEAEIGAELGKNSVGKSYELQNKTDLSTETLVKQDTGYMKVLGLSASLLAGGYRYNLISLVRGSHNFTSMICKSKSV